ncbi:hypothetical protein SDRG_14385 [Saprolegnia diclina VS20]|uniref:Uncharacterized protein n=1 Tax=Saprolegnia diclina (strain VS20) TaxID=1156394 RepID=T0PZX2_SAPDV|nr:hypothetical protein SDRG_14385 [Saprolegnia diclina VS20]EQC27801.1 hypothetical protein SDRG_14385 [Saprolegnia diclina VS20]|eukprot:XP_008618731.1 hypothetical protein SDRG_14385 [Saprolegnia diclina VS20]
MDTDNEAAHVRVFYDALRGSSDGLTITHFLLPLYFLQHATFTLVDATAVFDLVKGKARTDIMSLREYATALTKIAKIRYVTMPRSLARLLTDMQSWRDVAAVTSFQPSALLSNTVSGYDDLRLQMLSPGAVEMLRLYNHTIANAYHMYRRVSPTADASVETISLEGVVDFFGGYFVHPEYASTEDVHELAKQSSALWHRFVEVNVVPSTVVATPNAMSYPQFLELLCRVSHIVHLKLLREEHGHIRRHIQVARLEHSLKILLDHMQFDPHVAVIPSLQSQRPSSPKLGRLETLVQDIQKSIATLSQRTLEVLDAQVAQVRIEEDNVLRGKDRPTYALDVVVIHDVLAVPNFDTTVRRKVECALEYQNSGQLHMAWSMLHDAENELTAASRFNVMDSEAQLYFALSKGALFDSERRDVEALQQYMEALGVVDSLPPSHPGRAVVWSCLGSTCYYGGATLVALKCFDRAVTLREETLTETHVDTATSLNNLACCFYALGNIGHAAVHFRAVLRVFESCLEPYHPRTAVVQRNYDMARRHQTRFLHDAGHVHARDDLKYLIPGSTFQIGCLERVEAPKKVPKVRAD